MTKSSTELTEDDGGTEPEFKTGDGRVSAICGVVSYEVVQVPESTRMRTTSRTLAIPQGRQRHRARSGHRVRR